MIRRIALTYRSAFSGLSRDTWLLSLVMLINRATMMVAPFMSMYVTQSMHRSIADAGLVITLFGVGAVAGSAAGGYFIDKAGFRTVQILTALVGGGLFILVGHADNFLLLCGLTVLVSFVTEAFRPANFAAVAAYSTPNTLTRSYSLNRLASNLGWALGVSIAGLLAALNYHLLFWVEGGANILVGLLIIMILPAGRGARKERISVTPDGASAGEPEIASPQPETRSPWKDSFVLRFSVLTTLYTACFILLFTLVPVYWKEQLHIGESSIGLLMGLNGILIALFEMVLVSYWENRRTKMYYVVVGVAVTGFAFALLLLPVFSSLLMALALVCLVTLGEMLAAPFINSIIMSRSNDSNRGKYSAIYALSWSIARILGPGGGALIVEKWGYQVLWIILVLVCLGCAVTFKLLSAKPGQPRENRRVLTF